MLAVQILGLKRMLTNDYSDDPKFGLTKLQE